MSDLEELQKYTKIYYGQIDKEMIPILIELNKKGYGTQACCQGHTRPIKRFNSVYGYIMFDKDYQFEKPFVIEKTKNNSMSAMIKHDNVCSLVFHTRKTVKTDLKERERQEIMKAIYEWAKELP